MEKPLVSVICLCYNQKPYVKAAIQSVLDQDYSNTQVIVIDDASTDGSQEEINKILIGRTDIHFLRLDKNLGNTGAFNQGLALSRGKYIVDLACDDLLLNDRISRQVTFFEKQNQITGVIYSDAEYIDEKDHLLGRHFRDFSWFPHTGDVYSRLVSGYFIHPTTMMVKKDVFDYTGGYDDALSYEDFDFWVRSSRVWNYGYQDEVLTKIRKVGGSHGSRLYSKSDSQLYSTVRICKKILKMNQSTAENEALVIRLKYEIKHAYLTGNKVPVCDFLSILSQISSLSFSYRFLKMFNWGMNFSFLRKLFLRLKYRDSVV